MIIIPSFKTNIEQILLFLYRYYLKTQKTQFFVEELHRIIVMGQTFKSSTVSYYIKTLHMMNYIELNDGKFYFTPLFFEKGKELKEKFEKTKIELNQQKTEISKTNKLGFYKY